MPRWLGALAFRVLCVFIHSNVHVEAGNTTCAGNLTDWYTNAVGETACQTYQRLRQICNPEYQVPSFRQNTPGDNCDDQLADCCCNSVSWALSMLCMNCQWDVIGGSPNGIDAGVGAYGMYRSPSGSFCSPGTNQSLPADIQTASCNANIKLDNFLYELFWVDGSWFFVYTMDYAGEQQVQYNNNTFSHCNSTASTTSVALATGTSLISAPTSAASATVTPSTSSSQSETASIAGGVVGGVGGLALILGTVIICWRRRKQPPPGADRGMATFSTIIPQALASTGDSAQPSSNGLEQTRHPPAYMNLSSDFGQRSDPEASYPSQNASIAVRSDPAIEPARHEDLGSASTLHRSPSGRLPPAYNPQWGPLPRTQARPLPQPASTDSGTSSIVTQPQLV